LGTTLEEANLIFEQLWLEDVAMSENSDVVGADIRQNVAPVVLVEAQISVTGRLGIITRMPTIDSQKPMPIATDSWPGRRIARPNAQAAWRPATPVW
jgi:hypothetical protein